MYLFLTLLSGFVLSVMISVNGSLTARYGTFPATAIIHLVGSLFALLLCAMQREKRALWGRKPRWMYLGGAIGVLTSVFQNFAFGHISVTSIVALGLLGQTVTSLLVDRFGLMGMPRQPAQRTPWFGLAIALVGVIVMLDSSVAMAIVAVLAALGSGVTVVLSRTVNARLASETGALRGSLVNHLVGLPIAVVLALVLPRGAAAATAGAGERPWIYLGGVLGVIAVLLFNLVVPKVSSFRVTLLSFIGQVFTGAAIDLLFGNGSVGATFTGGVIVSLGVIVNLMAEQLHAKKERGRTPCRDAALEQEHDGKTNE